ncbi:MAG: ABC transporter permease [Sphingobacteriales bacterium]|nr:MAG: ABC transporter permease [Sphingobacteriales bacterium]
MNTILTIFRKEMTTTLRDRRTLISAILLPVLAMPLLLLGITKFSKVMAEKEATKTLRIVLNHAPEALQQQFRKAPGFTLLPQMTLAAARDSVTSEAYDAVLDFDPAFESSIDSLQSGQVAFYYKSTNTTVEDRVSQVLDAYKADLLKARFQRLNLEPAMLEPLTLRTVNVASKQEQLGMMAGGFLPYVFILFCFMACMYPALDLITGEKEKGTLETLLTTPASRFQILLGKVLTIGVVGVFAAVMTIVGMFAALRLFEGIPPEVLRAMEDILSLRFVLLLFGMLVPLSLFFAGLLSAIVIRASSFKEAQTFVSPMMFVVIVPAMMALIPGVRLTWQTAAIPILNIALATKDITAGTIHYGQYALLVISLLIAALLALAISVRQFSKEGNILK